MRSPYPEPEAPTQIPWYELGVCKGRDPELYSLDNPNVPRLGSASQEYARGVCAWCPVLIECALAAIENDDCGVIRAGIVLGEYRNRSDRAARLERVIAEYRTGAYREKWEPPVEVLPEQRFMTKLNNKRAFERSELRWRHRKCLTCGTPLRPRKSDPDLWPGRTEVVSGTKYCPTHHPEQKRKSS